MEVSRMVLDRFGIKGSGRPSTLAFAFDACGFERTDTLMHEKEKLFEKTGAEMR
ncbi:MAG: hypothetical protein IJI68_09110 [Eggerthellaceae bacterium]|nr:hypothetical protein [Eggerthellaceae bacterium]